MEGANKDDVGTPLEHKLQSICVKKRVDIRQGKAKEIGLLKEEEDENDEMNPQCNAEAARQESDTSEPLA